MNFERRFAMIRSFYNKFFCVDRKGSAVKTFLGFSFEAVVFCIAVWGILTPGAFANNSAGLNSESEAVLIRDGFPCLTKKTICSSDLRIAFYGSGLLTGYDFRKALTEKLAQYFPKSRVEHIAATAEYGEAAVYRFESDLLGHEPDLIVLDLAALQSDLSEQKVLQIADGIIRKAWRQDPSIEFLFVYPAVSGSEKFYEQGQRPTAVRAWEQLAEKYRIPSIDLTAAILDDFAGSDQNTLLKTDKKDLRFSDISKILKKYLAGNFQRPSVKGQRFYIEAIRKGVERMIRKKSSGINFDHFAQLEKKPVPNNWERAGMSAVLESMRKGNWINEMRIESASRSSYGKTGIPVWASGTPGDTVSFKFKGKEAGLLDVVGSDSAMIHIAVDGRRMTFDRKDPQAALHRPSVLMFVRDLDPDQVHEVMIEVGAGGSFRLAKLLIDGELQE